METATIELNTKNSKGLKEKETISIALLGQPNAGKSTLFNALTGSQQHVGNWPGKTVEQKTGSFSHNGKQYNITDLPGSYSLSANSAEEMVTRDFIATGQADLVCILADASQLERSLFMLADYAGINCPVVLVLNMMDVAQKQGKTIDATLLEKRLGVPVAAMSASNKKDYDGFYKLLEKPFQLLNNEFLVNSYKNAFGELFDVLCENIQSYGSGFFSSEWITSKILENDSDVIAKTAYKGKTPDHESIIKVGSCKFEWIKTLLDGCVTKPESKRHQMSKFDRLATSSRWGKPLAILLLISGLLSSFIVAMPFMFGVVGLPKILFPPIESWMQNIGAAFWIISLTGTLFNVMFSCIALLGFIAGSAFVFGLMEDIGYMARVSYVFENVMSRFSLHGKSIMAFMMSFGCSLGGSLSTRVIDTWGQRMLTMAIAWAVPCAGTWGVISVFGTAFFGINTIWVLLALFASSLGIMFITAKFYAPKFIDKKQNYGLIMELPPYHKPKWGSLFRFVFSRIGNFAKKAFTYFLLVTAVFWILAYSADGNIEHSIIYKFGKMVEPVTMWFGLRWQTFVAFICSLMGKEGALGALSSIFGASSHVIGLDGEVSPDLATQMSTLLTKPEALAFMFAFYFNVPCLVAVLQVKEESHSWKWTLRLIGFYLVVALLMGALAYYVGQLIF